MKRTRRSSLVWVLALTFALAGGILISLGSRPSAAHESGGEGPDLGLKLLHGVPGLSVDIEIGGGRRYKRVETGFVIFLGDQPSEDLHLTFKRSGTDEILLDVESPEFASSGRSTMLFHQADDGSLAVTTFDNVTSALAPGSSRLIVRYQGSGPKVDLLLAGDGPVLIDDLSSGEESFLDLPVGALDVVVVPSSAEGDRSIDPVALDLTEGDAVVAYILGQSESGGFVVATDTVHDVDIDETAVGPTDIASALDRGSAFSSIPVWVHLLLAALVAATLAFFASRYARGQENRVISGR